LPLFSVTECRLQGALRRKGEEGELKRKREYGRLLRLTRQILNGSRRVWQEVEALPARRRRSVSGLVEGLEAMADQVRRVVRRTKARVFAGLVRHQLALDFHYEFPHISLSRGDRRKS